MKKEDRKALPEMTLVELQAKSRDLRQEQFNLRLQQASSRLENPAQLRTLRRDVARIELGSQSYASYGMLNGQPAADGNTAELWTANAAGCYTMRGTATC